MVLADFLVTVYYFYVFEEGFVDSLRHVEGLEQRVILLFLVDEAVNLIGEEILIHPHQ